MPGVAKCPLCGESGDMDSLSFVCLNKKCYFSCKIKDLPRISAAMESQANPDELRERVAWMRECEAEQRSIVQEGFHPKSYHRYRHTEFLMTLLAARRAVEELL